MDQTVQAVLAGILSLTPPGRSIHSRAVIDSCDESCQTQRVCSEPTTLCDKPKFSYEIFDKKLDLNKKETLSLEQWKEYENEIKMQSFTRAESYEEGLQRYTIIAAAIVETSKSLSWKNINEKCKEECKSSPYSNNCKQCSSARPWSGTEDQLNAALITIFNKEGGFREDVHSGIGPLSKGDCKWQNVLTHKRASAYSSNATPIPGSCRSFCLGQINIANDIKFGYKANDLIGADFQSTKRCAEVTGRILSQSRSRCSGKTDYTGDWVAGMFSSYGTGGNCKAINGTGITLKPARWPSERAAMYRRVLTGPRELKESVRTLLGIADEEVVVGYN